MLGSLKVDLGNIGESRCCRLRELVFPVPRKSFMSTTGLDLWAWLIVSNRDFSFLNPTAFILDEGCKRGCRCVFAGPELVVYVVQRC